MAAKCINFIIFEISAVIKYTEICLGHLKISFKSGKSDE